MVSPKFSHLLMDGFKFMFSEFRETPVIFWVALKKLPYMRAKEMNFWSNVEIIWTITCQFQVCISKVLNCLLPAWLPDQTKAGVFHNRIGIEDVNELPACFSCSTFEVVSKNLFKSISPVDQFFTLLPIPLTSPLLW